MKVISKLNKENIENLKRQIRMWSLMNGQYIHYDRNDPYILYLVSTGFIENIEDTYSAGI
jgi:hypothetical protein